MARAKAKAKMPSYDENRETLGLQCEGTGYGSVVRCNDCKKVCAIIFKDFCGQSDLGIDINWNGNASEAHVVCEDCGDGY